MKPTENGVGDTTNEIPNELKSRECEDIGCQNNKLPCSKCKKFKPLGDFVNDNRLASMNIRYGKSYQCKECRKEYQDKWNKMERAKEIHALNEKIRRERHPERTMVVNAKIRARENGLEFNLKKEDIVIPEFCPVLGIKLVFGTGKLHDNSPTLDRIDNNKGYTKDNIQVISWRANKIKGYATIDDLEQILFYMKANSSNYRSSGKHSMCKKNRGSRLITFNNRTQSLIDWSDELKISYDTLASRINRDKWPIEKAFSQPVKHKKRKNY